MSWYLFLKLWIWFTQYIVTQTQGYSQLESFTSICPVLRKFMSIFLADYARRWEESEINSPRTNSSSTNEPGLLDLLIDFRASDCTDPRDKVNALLGLARARDVVGLLPDYSMTVEQVYSRTAARIIEASASLDILAVSCSAETVLNLPSWVPDWSITETEADAAGAGGWKDTASDHAIYSASAQTSLAFQVSESGTMLCLSAVVLAGLAYTVPLKGRSKQKQNYHSIEDALIGKLQVIDRPF